MNFFPPVFGLALIGMGGIALGSTFLNRSGNLQTPNITNTRYIFSKEKDFSQPQLEVENTQTLLAFALFYIAAVLLFVKGIYDGILIYAGYSRYSDKAVYEIANKAFKEPWS